MITNYKSMLQKEKIANMDDLAPLIIEAIDNQCDVKLTVTGNSMYPLFRNGIDCVVLTKIGRISKYDIPLYKRKNGTYVLHRIVKIKNGILYLAGDYETRIEHPIYPSQLIANTKGFYRNGAYISCNQFWYKIYSYLWVVMIPYRKKIIRWFKGIRRKLRAK